MMLFAWRALALSSWRLCCLLVLLLGAASWASATAPRVCTHACDMVGREPWSLLGAFHF